MLQQFYITTVHQTVAHHNIKIQISCDTLLWYAKSQTIPQHQASAASLLQSNFLTVQEERKLRGN